MFNKQRRCSSTNIDGLRCEYPAGHTIKHRALSLETKQFVFWDRKPPPSIKIPEHWTLEKHQTSKPIIGWRWWRIGDRGILTSVTSDYEWLSPVGTTALDSEGKPKEVCPRNPIRDPRASALVDDEHSGYDWGIYSYKTPKLLRNHNPYMFRRLKQEEGNKYLVMGKIECTKGIEHEFGYRTKDAIIRELWLFYNNAEITFNESFKERTERRYACDLHFVHMDKIDSWIHFYSQKEE